MKQEMMRWQWHQLNHMQIIYLAPDRWPSLNCYRPDALPDAQPTASRHRRQSQNARIL